MSRGVVFVLSVLLSFPAFAESSISMMLLPALIGVTNRSTDDEYARLLKIDRKATVYLSLERGEGGCTGRFVNPTTLLTAAHCVNRKTSGGEVNVNGVESVNWFISEDYKDEKEGQVTLEDAKHDLAVVVFPEGTGEFLGIESYVGLAEKGAEAKKGWIVGYGADRLANGTPAGTGVKGWGTFNIRGSQDELLITEAGNLSAETRGANEKPGERVAALMGDSGAVVHNGDGKIFAVVSGMDGNYLTVAAQLDPQTIFIHRELTGYYNVLVDATNERAKKLYRSAIQCAKNPCAGNFAGSGVDADKDYPIREKSPEHNNEKMFSHVSLRTGKYKPAVNSGKGEMFITSHYDGNTLAFLTIRRVKDGGRVQDKIGYACERENCAGGTLGSSLLTVAKGNKFSLKPFFGKAEPYELVLE